MLPLLDKPFEFATDIPLEECLRLLEKLSKRGVGWLASRRDLLVKVNSDATPIAFSMDRATGKGLVAEVYGSLSSRNNVTHVAGYGHISPLIAGFITYFICMCAVFAFVFRAVPLMALFCGAGSIASILMLYSTFKNRQNLIDLVQKTVSDS